MNEAFICDYQRTPIGRFGGKLSTKRPDDLAAEILKVLCERNHSMNVSQLDDVLLGCANQAGEDNRNIARMALLLAGLPDCVPGGTVNRLCGSGMDSILTAFRMIRSGEAELLLAGGVESMSRAPFVVPKSERAFSRSTNIYDTTIGWRFVNPILDALYGTDSMPQTAENVAAEYDVSREDQDQFSVLSQKRAQSAIKSGRLAKEIAAISLPQRRGGHLTIDVDEHPRPDTTIEDLSELRPLLGSGTTITAGNASGINDGAAAMIIASEAAIQEHGLTPMARIVGGSVVGVAPRLMGIGPAPATQKLLAKFGWKVDAIDRFEFNEAFAAQVLACSRLLGLHDDDPRINSHGGSISLGHPLGMSGTRITGTAAVDISSGAASRSISAMCIGVGQGIAIALEKV